MSTSVSACYDFAAHTPRDFQRKNISYNFFGSAAIACLVVGCAWTVYSNIFAAGIYPSAGNFDVAVIKRSPAPVRNMLTAANSSVVIESPSLVSAPATVAQQPSFSFDDRFAAAAPQSVAPAPQAVAAAPQAASRPQVAALTPAAAERKVVDAVQTPPSRPAEARKSNGASVRDMAQRAKAAVMSVASNDKPEAPAKPPTIFERLFGKFEFECVQRRIGTGLCVGRRQQHVLAWTGQPEHRFRRHRRAL